MKRSLPAKLVGLLAVATVACATGGGRDGFEEGTNGGATDGGTAGADGGKGPTPLPDGGSPNPGSSKILINEIMTAGSGDVDDVEFIELHNPGSNDVAVADWTLQYRSAANSAAEIRLTFGAGDVIAGGAYVVVGSPKFSPKDFTFVQGLKIGGAQIALLDANDTIVDRVGWGATTSGDFTSGDPAPMAPAGQSIARTADTGKNDLDFVVATTPTPGNAN